MPLIIQPTFFCSSILLYFYICNCLLIHHSNCLSPFLLLLPIFLCSMCKSRHLKLLSDKFGENLNSDEENLSRALFQKGFENVMALIGTRPDTRLPQSRAGGQGPYLRSLDHFGRSSEAIDRKNLKKVKCDGPTEDGLTDQRTNGMTE